jgi:hypothetical protein
MALDGASRTIRETRPESSESVQSVYLRNTSLPGTSWSIQWDSEPWKPDDLFDSWFIPSGLLGTKHGIHHVSDALYVTYSIPVGDDGMRMTVSLVALAANAESGKQSEDREEGGRESKG